MDMEGGNDDDGTLVIIAIPVEPGDNNANTIFLHLTSTYTITTTKNIITITTIINTITTNNNNNNAYP